MPFFYNTTIPSTTWEASGATPSAFFGNVLFTDLGIDGAIGYSDGTKWIIPNRLPILRGGVITGTAPSGTFGNNGAVTFSTALVITMSMGGYLYYPANRIAAGVPAGLYWTEMTSTTTGVVYNNTYTGGQPLSPAIKVPFFTTGAGAYTATTATDITVLSGGIKGKLLGKNGNVTSEFSVFCGGNVNSKLVKHYLNSSFLSSSNITSQMQVRNVFGFSNNNSESSQIFVAVIGFGGTATQPTNAANIAGVDTTINTTYAITAQVTNAADYILIVSYDVAVRPGI